MIKFSVVDAKLERDQIYVSPTTYMMDSVAGQQKATKSEFIKTNSCAFKDKLIRSTS